MAMQYQHLIGHIRILKVPVKGLEGIWIRPEWIVDAVIPCLYHVEEDTAPDDVRTLRVGSAYAAYAVLQSQFVQALAERSQEAKMYLRSMNIPHYPGAMFYIEKECAEEECSETKRVLSLASFKALGLSMLDLES